MAAFNAISNECRRAIASKNKLLIAGNGGSAAEAQHFAAELVGRYKQERAGLPALALTTDTSVITAWSNDYSFETIFSRQIEALGMPGDIFIGLSTSGNSKNILAAVERARNRGLTTACFLGNKGGMLQDKSDHALVVPSSDTPRIQEIHLVLIHALCDEIESLM